MKGGREVSDGTSEGKNQTAPQVKYLGYEVAVNS